MNLQADGGFSSSSQVDGDALVSPGVRQLSAFDGQNLASLQQGQPGRAGQRTAVLVPGDGWDTQGEVMWGGCD